MGLFTRRTIPYEAPAANAPTASVSNAETINQIHSLLEPVKYPFSTPNARSTTAVTAMETKRAWVALSIAKYGIYVFNECWIRGIYHRDKPSNKVGDSYSCSTRVCSPY